MHRQFVSISATLVASIARQVEPQNRYHGQHAIQLGVSPTLDPTYGYDQTRLLQVSYPAGPSDFDAFWQDIYAQALALPLNLEKRVLKSPNPLFELWEVKFDAFGGARIGAWITIPKNAIPQRGFVVGHGYGGRSEPDFNLPGPPAVTILPCARGFHLSATPGIPGDGHKHVLIGIEDRETYVHRGCVTDLWAAASVLRTLFPEASQNLHYFGGSFGGGMGALMLPWDNRFSRAFLDVPSFGNHPLRVTMPCIGSGESVRKYYKKRPEVLEVMAYYDAATAASRIKIPVFVAAALSDPAVPPPGQFAVYNAIPGEKELFVRQTGHPDTPEDWVVLRPELDAWFGKI